MHELILFIEWRKPQFFLIFKSEIFQISADRKELSQNIRHKLPKRLIVDGELHMYEICNNNYSVVPVWSVMPFTFSYTSDKR